MTEILTDEALAFVAELHRRFRPRRDELLAAARRAPRRDRRAAARSDFLPETAEIRAGDWTVPAAPADLTDRRVEITGPTERKMTINALNSGAKVWLADLEDANTPHWANVVGGQLNLYDAIRRTITPADARRQDATRCGDGPYPTIVMRPRGWHLDERHLPVDGEPAVGALVDFGLYFFHNAAELLDRGSGPYFYLPKMESHLEARAVERRLHYAAGARSASRTGTIRATVLIETIPAAFEMDEILYELRPHASGLNAGRWDYLFSIIKNFRDNPAIRAARPGRGDDDGAVHARVHRAARRDLPPARRVRDGRHGRVHPQPPRPRGQRGRAGQGPRGQGARGRRRLRRLLGGPPRPGAGLPGGLRPGARRPARTSSTGSATTSPSTADAAARRRRHAGRGHRGRAARQRLGRRCSTSSPGCAATARSRSTT